MTYWWEEPRAPEKTVPEEIVWARDTPSKHPQSGEMTIHGIVPEMPEWGKVKRGRKPIPRWVGGKWRWQMPRGGGRKVKTPQKRHPHTVMKKLKEYEGHPERWEEFEKESEGFRNIVKNTERETYFYLQQEKEKQVEIDKILGELSPTERKAWEKEFERREKIFAENVPDLETIRAEEQALYDWIIKGSVGDVPATPFLDKQEADILERGLKQEPAKQQILSNAGIISEQKALHTWVVRGRVGDMPATPFLDIQEADLLEQGLKWEPSIKRQILEKLLPVYGEKPIDLDKLTPKVQHRIHEIIDRELDTGTVLAEYRGWVEDAAKEIKPYVQEWAKANSALSFADWFRQTNPEKASILDRVFREDLPSHVKEKHPELQEGTTVEDVLPEMYKDTEGLPIPEYKPTIPEYKPREPAIEAPMAGKPWWRKAAEAAITVFSLVEPHIRTGIETAVKTTIKYGPMYGPYGEIATIKKAWVGLQTAFAVTDEPFSARQFHGDIRRKEAAGETLTPWEAEYREVYDSTYGPPMEIPDVAHKTMRGMVTAPPPEKWGGPHYGKYLPPELREVYQRAPWERKLFYEIINPVWFIPIGGILGAVAKKIQIVTKGTRYAKIGRIAEKGAEAWKFAGELPAKPLQYVSEKLSKIIKKPPKVAAFDINKILTKKHHEYVQTALMSDDWFARSLRKIGEIKPLNRIIRFFTPSSGHLTEAEKILNSYYLVRESSDSLVTLISKEAGIGVGANPAADMTKLFGFVEKKGNWYKGTAPAADWLEKVNRSTLTKVQREFLEAADRVKAMLLDNYLMNGGKRVPMRKVHWPRFVSEKDGTMKVFVGGKGVGIFSPGSMRGRIFDEAADGIATGLGYAHPYDALMLQLRSMGRASNNLILKGRLTEYMHSLGKHIPVDTALIKGVKSTRWNVKQIQSMDKYLKTALLRAAGGKQISATAFPLQRKRILARITDLDFNSPEVIQKAIKANKDILTLAKKESGDLATKLAAQRKLYHRTGFLELSVPGTGFQNIKLPQAEVQVIGKLLKQDSKWGGILVDGLVTMNDAIRFVQAGYDLGIGNLHLLPMLFTNPVAWGKAMGNSVKYMAKPKAFDAFVVKNADTIMEMIQKANMNPGMTPEYMKFLKGGGKILKKGPLGTITSAFEREFSTALFQSQVLDYKAHKHLLKFMYKENWEKHLPELGAAIDKRLGTLNTSRLSLTASRSRIEGAIFYAPRYLRSFMGVLVDSIRGGIRSAVALETLGGLAAGYLLTNYATSKALEQEPRLDPTRGDFLSHDVKDPISGKEVRVAQGGNFRWMMRAIASIAKAAREEPDSFLRFSKEDIRTNPLIRPLLSKLSVIAGMGMDVWTGKTFLGEPWTVPEVYMQEVPETLLPFWMEWEYTENKRIPVRPHFMVGEFFGLQQYSLSDWMKFEQKAEAAIKGETGQSFGFADKRWRDLTRQEKMVLYNFNPELEKMAEQLRKKRADWFPNDKMTQYFGGLEEIQLYYETQLAALERRTKEEIIPERGHEGWSPSCGEAYRDEQQEIRYLRNGEYNRLAIDYKDVIAELDELKERQGIGDVTNNSLVQCLLEYETIIRFATDLEYPKDDPLRPGEYKWEEREAREVYLKETYGEETYKVMEQILEAQRDASLTKMDEARQVDLEYLANTLWKIEFPEGDKGSSEYRVALQATYDQRDVVRITDPYVDALYSFWGYGSDFDGLKSKDAVDLYLLHCQVLNVDEPAEVKLASGIVPSGKQWIPVNLLKDSFAWAALDEQYAEDKKALREARIRFRVAHKDWTDFVYGAMPGALETLVD